MNIFGDFENLTATEASIGEYSPRVEQLNRVYPEPQHLRGFAAAVDLSEMWPFKPNIEKLTCRRDVRRLTDLLYHSDPAIQDRAAVGLVDIAKAEGLDTLCSLLDHTCETVARAAADSLCAIGGAEVASRMVAILPRGARPHSSEFSAALGVLVRVGDVSALATAVTAGALAEAQGANGVAGHLQYLITYHAAWFSDDQLTLLKSLEDRAWHIRRSRWGMIQFSDPDTFPEGYDDYKLSYGRLRRLAAKELKNRRRRRQSSASEQASG